MKNNTTALATLLLLLTPLTFLSANEGLYPSSVVGTNFDYITADDPNTFLCMEYQGKEEREVVDKRGGGAGHEDVYVFNTHFTDGTTVDLYMDKDFGDKTTAQTDAMRYTSRLGKLPTDFRENVRYVLVHKGGVDVTAQAEDLGHFFMIYSDNATKRISTHDLEETFFHEGVHAGIQQKLLRDDPSDWNAAVTKDGAYVTNYASVNSQEDFAESALFAYTLQHNPDRIPAADRAKIEAAIPNRLAFFEPIFKTPTYSVRSKHTCSGSAILAKDIPQDKDLLTPSHSTIDNVPNESHIKPASDSTSVRNLDEALQDALVIGLNEDEENVKRFLEPWRGTKDEAALLDATETTYGYNTTVIFPLLKKFNYTPSTETSLTATKRAEILAQINELLKTIAHLMTLVR